MLSDESHLLQNVVFIAAVVTVVNLCYGMYVLIINNYYVVGSSNAVCVGITNTNSKFRFSIQKLHHCIRESVPSTMQKLFYEYT